ncbi:MAG TPA: D-alanyl-D-alanine endopeptidase [Methylotenera sp.]|nr:D-alanyl-D-alanine endopeptidase [Methylotenera sp.]HPH04531.1 D-alanyl-D-alanine endopeptidase [Methylotenera sp.]HPN00795.1 D-alanyl-D-alanine endopeptidase [Methylotenera sp.]
MRKLLVISLALMLSLSSAMTFAKTQKKVTSAKYTLNKNLHGKYKLAKFKPSEKVSVKKSTKIKSASSTKMRVKLRKQQPVYVQQQTIFAEAYDGSGPLELASTKAMVIHQQTGEVIYAKNTQQSTPIASVTKLMTAMVMLDAQLPMEEVIYIAEDDIDYLKGTSSRLSVGTSLTRAELLQLALMSSENRAASAIARNYPGGYDAFIRAMNRKATSIGMRATEFYDPTGLDSNNVSTAEDLVKMVKAAYKYDEIRLATTSTSQEFNLYAYENPVNFVNTNALVRNGDWHIGLSKTGFISEAGRCLVMQAEISGQPLIIVLLDSAGKLSRIGDANRIRKWVEYNNSNIVETIALGEHVSG